MAQNIWHRVFKPSVAAALIAAPLLAGALVLQIGDPAANPEAKAKNAAVVARISACRSPEKTVVTAVAIGMIDGKAQTMPLKVMTLTTAGTFAVTQEWPDKGTWVIKFVATNPDYKNYATGALVRVSDNTPDWTLTKNYFHEPNTEDVSSLLH